MYFTRVEAEIRKIVGNDQIDVILDNIGLPYSGINIALSDSATVGPMDGEILVSLKEEHTPTAKHVADLRRELPKIFPDLQFFFQPADIVDQVLNFGQPAPIDIRITGPNNDEAYSVAAKLAHDLQKVPGIVDSHVFQVPNAPSLSVDVDRALATQLGLDQVTTAQQCSRLHQLERADRAEFLARSTRRRQLPSGRADAALSDRLDARPLDLAGHPRYTGRSRASF